MDLTVADDDATRLSGVGGREAVPYLGGVGCRSSPTLGLWFRGVGAGFVGARDGDNVREKTRAAMDQRRQRLEQGGARPVVATILFF